MSRSCLPMKRMGAVLFAGIMLLSAMGCQATPEEEAVVDRSDGGYEQVVRATTEPGEETATVSHWEYPSHWTEDIAVNDSLTISVDCDVEMGEGEEHPVYQIARRTIDGQFLYDAITAAWPDADGVREQQESREELLDWLKVVQRGALSGGDDDIGFAPYEGQDEDIAEIQAKLEETPAESTYVPFVKENLEVGDYRDFTIRTASGKLVQIEAHVNSARSTISMITCHGASIQPEQWVLGGDAILGEAPHELKDVNISEEEAIATADVVIARLGKDDMQLAKAEKARCLGYWDVVSEGWRLTYTVAVPGTVPALTAGYQPHDLFQAEEDYRASWRQEAITLYVTGNGVEAFTWSNAYAMDGILSEDVELLPFDRIQEIVAKQLKYGLAWVENPITYGLGEKVNITRVVLTTTTALLKDQRDVASLVPTWAIYYISTDEEKYHMDESLLLINAIDGSMVTQVI